MAHVLVEKVEEMIGRGAPFERVEAYIEELVLGEDAKSALWLLAWVECDRPTRRKAVSEVLMLCSD